MSSAPALESVAAELYRSLLPLAYADAASDYPLARYLAGIGNMTQDVDDIVRDTPAGPGWSPLLDLERIPDKGLPWLAQIAGVEITGGLPPDAQREQIRAASARRRGTVGALVAAAQRHLTGNKVVGVTERDGSAYRISVVTLTGETPDLDAVYAALLDAKAAGLVLNYTNLDGQTYQSLFANNATYQVVFTKYATYRGAFYDQPGV